MDIFSIPLPLGRACLPYGNYTIFLPWERYFFFLLEKSSYLDKVA